MIDATGSIGIMYAFSIYYGCITYVSFMHMM